MFRRLEAMQLSKSAAPYELLACRMNMFSFNYLALAVKEYDVITELIMNRTVF
jgi:hypothetical protein